MYYEICMGNAHFSMGSYTNHVDRAGGRGVSKLSMLVHKGGGGFSRMVHVDFFSGLESLFSNNYFKK